MKKAAFFLLLVFFLLGSILFWKGRKVPSSDRPFDWVCGLRAEDRFALEAFLRYLMFDEGFGYVVYGEKPLVMSMHCKPMIENLFCYRVSQKNVIVGRGYEVFCKFLQKHRLSDDFVFLVREQNDWVTMTLIHKDRLMRTVDENSAAFQGVLGDRTTSASFLKDLVESNGDLSEVCKGSQMLLGIIFGYESHNAKLFEERDKIASCISIPKMYRPDLIKSEKLQELESRLTPFDDEELSPLVFAPLISCVVDPAAEETKRMRQSYKAQRKKIAAIYRDGNFLKTTVEHLYQ